jgi:hypothetical protein
METIQAVLASVAGNMMGNKDPITNFVAIHPTAHLNNLSCNLMAEDTGSFFDPIPFHDIATADAAGQHLG